MSEDLSLSNNDLLRTLNSTVMNDSWLQAQYSSSRAEQQAELQKIFTVIADNDVSDSEKRQLQARAKSLEQKLNRLEDKLMTLKSELEATQDKIEKNANEITKLVTSAENKSEKLESDCQKFVKNCIDETFKLYESGKIGKDQISVEIRKKVRSGTVKMRGQSGIQSVINKLEQKKSTVSALIKKTADWIDKKNILQSQYGITKSAYNMIAASLKQIGNTSTSYTNSDTDYNVPVYSLEKTDIVSDLFENSLYNVSSTNTSYIDGSTEANAAIAYGSTSTSESSRQLSSAREGDYITTITEVTTTTTRTGYKNNTWNENAGNTISSNAQIKTLSENYSAIIDKLAYGEPKFTYKEAMYALFNQKTGLFKNSGVVYDVNNLNNGQPTYQIQAAGDAATAAFYQALGNKISSAWGVAMSPESAQRINGIIDVSTAVNTKSSSSYEPVVVESYEVQSSRVAATSDTSYNSSSNNYTARREKPQQPVLKTSNVRPQVYCESGLYDPITFAKGNTEYAFVIDRNSNGAFSGVTEFVGGKQGVSWLEDLKSLDMDGDGRLNREELKNLKILASSYADNTSGSSSTTNISYSMTNAQAMGIEEIDLTNLENNVNQSTGTYDINGSEIFNDSFTFKMNGELITASRKDDNTAFVNAVYGNSFGKSFEVGLSESQVQATTAMAYSSLDEELNGFDPVFANINTLLGLDDTIKDVKKNLSETMGEIERDEAMQLTKATTRANALPDDKGDWNEMQQEVRNLADKLKVEIDIDHARTLFASNDDYSARELVDLCTKKDLAKEAKIEEEKAEEEKTAEAKAEKEKEAAVKKAQKEAQAEEKRLEKEEKAALAEEKRALKEEKNAKLEEMTQELEEQEAYKEAQILADEHQETMLAQQQVEDERADAEEKIAQEAWDASIECSKRGIIASSSEIRALLESGEAKDAQEVVKILERRK